MTDDWTIFPLANPEITCGLRLDFPKKQRVHHLISLGLDTRNAGSKGFLDREIYACSRCGKDIAKPVRENNDDTSGGIPASSDNPHPASGETVLSARRPRAVQETQPIP